MIILGSQSPRRKEILEFFDLPFEQAAPPFDEESVPFNGNPGDYVLTLAQGKGESLLGTYPSRLILTADTVVFKEGKVYHKPKDETQAFQHLKELAGHWHEVYTGLTVFDKDRCIQHVQMTRVLFNALSDEQIHHYQNTLHWTDKAGGYMIQGSGGLIVRSIEGCYYNVMGLPLNGLCEVMMEAGGDLWRH
ncbi:MAG: Maf family protein, partial [Parachlamydia sp.]|nr:Maf family protein [Parachlamydia sp.]